TVWRGTTATAEVQYDCITAVFGICSEENINVAGRVEVHLWSGVFDKIAMTRCGLWNARSCAKCGQIGQQSFTMWQGWLKCNVDAGFY
ncbi:hypothetical protein A2U01_0026925, partial [Trifolium medium]|nr:hypothetical protein [Trifolium medium]